MDILAYMADVEGGALRVSCSDGKSISTKDWSELITFLLEPCDMAVVYRLDEFAGAMAEIMPQDVREALKYSGKVYLPDHTKIYYIQGRICGITYAGREVNIYGLSRYSDEEPEDVYKLAELGQRVVKAFEQFGVKAKKLTSPVAAYADVLNGLTFARAGDLPDNALEMVNKCYEICRREWREVYRLGHWGVNEVADYDLCSAYPSIIAELPDIRNAEFFTLRDVPAMRHIFNPQWKDYSWGVLSGTLRIDKPLSPFQYVGEWPDLITTEMLEVLRRWDIGDMEVEDGWFLKLPKVYAYPFRNIMQRLYRQRDSEDKLVSTIAKAISVGIGGRFSQTFQREGKFRLGDDFNSIYACMMTSRATIKVLDFIYRNHMEDDVISVMVDGCLSTRRLFIPESKAMGAWRRNPDSSALVLSLLYQWLSDKRPGGITYDGMMAMIQDNPDSTHYGDIDFNLLEYTRKFDDLPRTGGELLEREYNSVPFEKVGVTA